jgi:predicted permease
MLRRRRAFDGLDQDIRDHIERETQDNIERGMAPDEAHRRAMLKFGNVALVKEDTRAVWVSIWLEQLRQDVRYAFRTLRRNPGFAAVVILTLGLGIGANTAIFSLMDQVLLRMLPVERPSELVLLDGPGVYQGRTQSIQTFSVPMFRGLQAAEAPVLSGMFARYNTTATISIGNAAERAYAELVSGDYFRTLGVGTVLGRTLGPDDDRTPSAHPVVVLTHGYWQRRFAGDARVLNQDVRVNGHPMTVVGIAAPGFSGVDVGAPADVFVPLMMKREMTPTWNDLESWRGRWVTVMGRLAPGVSREQAAAALNVRYRQLLQEDVKTARLSSAEQLQFVEKNLLVLPGGRGRSGFRSQFATPLVVLMSMVGLVLLIACANVANLLMARAATQQKEVALRLALGAGRLRVVRQRLAETFVLAASGAIVGLLFARWTTSLLIEVLPFDRIARGLSPSPDLRVVLFAIGVASVTALVFGLAPALHATTPALVNALKEGTRGMAGGGGQARVRKGLVVAQVALSVLLLVGAGLFARSLYNLRSLNPGFVANNLLQFSLNAALSGYTRAEAQTLFHTIQEQVSAVPGVISASSSQVPALTNVTPLQTVKVQGYVPAEGQDMTLAFIIVGPGYFTTMGVPVVMGRELRFSDDERAPKVAVINEAMARFFWGDQSPIGRKFGRSGSGTEDEFEVVGVVRDSKFTNVRDEIPRAFYLPYMQAEALGAMTFYVRHRPGIEGVASTARRVVERLDPHLPILDVKTMDAQVDDSLFLERLVASLSIFFGVLATMVAAVGLYGVMSYTVSRRTQEIGVRMALGAARGAVLWMVLREVIVLVVSGIVLGLPLALGLSRMVESQLFGLSPTDPLTLGVVAILLATVAMLAGYLPARRATRVDPMLALRQD